MISGWIATNRLCAVLLVGSTALLAGCTSDSGGSPKPSATTSTSTPTVSDPPSSTTPTTAPSTSPSPATTGPNVRPGQRMPTLPAAARVDQSIGADAFARYWVQALDWGYSTMDSTLARRLYSSSCTGCREFVQTVLDDAKAKGQTYRGGHLSVIESQLKATDHHFGATAVVDLDLQQQPYRLLNSGGDVAEETRRQLTVPFRTWLVWKGGSWSIVDWKRIDSK